MHALLIDSCGDDIHRRSNECNHRSAMSWKIGVPGLSNLCCKYATNNEHRLPSLKKPDTLYMTKKWYHNKHVI